MTPLWRHCSTRIFRFRSKCNNACQFCLLHDRNYNSFSSRLSKNTRDTENKASPRYQIDRNHDVDFAVHGDVIKWKQFPRCWPFVRETTGGVPSQRPVTRSFDFFVCTPEQITEQTVHMPVIWGAMALADTSLFGNISVSCAITVLRTANMFSYIQTDKGYNWCPISSWVHRPNPLWKHYRSHIKYVKTISIPRLHTWGRGTVVYFKTSHTQLVNIVRYKQLSDAAIKGQLSRPCFPMIDLTAVVSDLWSSYVIELIDLTLGNWKEQEVVHSLAKMCCEHSETFSRVRHYFQWWWLNVRPLFIKR